jgi:hypothetical protein
MASSRDRLVESSSVGASSLPAPLTLDEAAATGENTSEQTIANLNPEENVGEISLHPKAAEGGVGGF